jgi:hypothetical protein
MKIQRFLVAALLVTATVSTATAARFYAQPSIAFAEVPDFKAKMGPSLAIGVLLAGKHAVEIEGGSFDTTSRYDSNFKLKAIPVTLGYRYEFPIAKRLSGSIGVAAGVTRQEGDYTFYYYAGYPYPGTPFVYRYSATDDAFTVGFQGGLSLRLNDHFALNFGVKALRVAETGLVSRGTTLIGQIGLNCRL